MKNERVSSLVDYLNDGDNIIIRRLFPRRRRNDIDNACRT